MIKKYYSNYTGKEIDEAVRAIVDNNITVEDLSPELIDTIKVWISEAGIEFLPFADFPQSGTEHRLYVATDKQAIYCWYEGAYILLAGNSVPYYIVATLLERNQLPKSAGMQVYVTEIETLFSYSGRRWQQVVHFDSTSFNEGHFILEPQANGTIRLSLNLDSLINDVGFVIKDGKIGLDIDSIVTRGSNKLITSGAVYDHVYEQVGLIGEELAEI